MFKTVLADGRLTETVVSSARLKLIVTEAFCLPHKELRLVSLRRTSVLNLFFETNWLVIGFAFDSTIES